ncbi:MAG: DUF6702 family protein [Parvularculaceae bacterium]
MIPRAILVLLAIATAPLAARAHDANFALTSVEWNRRASAVEVIHRLHAHHALDSATAELGRGAEGFASAESLAALGLYIAQRFALADASGAPIALEFIGAEIEGDYIVVYQEAQLPAPPTALRVRSDILADLSPDQVNHVNVSIDGEKRTLVFDESRRGAFLTYETPERDASAAPAD